MEIQMEIPSIILMEMETTTVMVAAVEIESTMAAAVAVSCHGKAKTAAVVLYQDPMVTITTPMNQNPEVKLELRLIFPKPIREEIRSLVERRVNPQEGEPPLKWNHPKNRQVVNKNRQHPESEEEEINWNIKWVCKDPFFV
jgi:hypothetical protein